MKLSWFLFSCITVLVFSAIFPCLAKATTAFKSEQSILEVLKNNETRRISIRAKNVSLKNVMERIVQVTGLSVKSSDASILDEFVEINLKDLTLKETIDRLLQGVNSVFFYSSEPTTGKDETPNLTKVMLLSRKEALPRSVITNRGKGEEKLKSKAQTNTVRLRLLAIVKSPLGNAILQGKMLETKRILKTLLESGTEEEIKEALEALGDILIQPDLYNQARNGHVFFEALEAYKKLDPQGGAVKMTNLLQSSEEPWVQSLTAQSLGELGQANSITSLTSAFVGNDPLVQDAAAASLAQIATDIGVRELFKATANGGPVLQQKIINALVLSGDEKSQATLAQAVAENLIPAELATEEAAAQQIESENSENN
ncbi:MAG: hypothetical protein VW455_08870 [Nitrospinota bacterium]